MKKYGACVLNDRTLEDVWTEFKRSNVPIEKFKYTACKRHHVIGMQFQFMDVQVRLLAQATEDRLLSHRNLPYLDEQLKVELYPLLRINEMDWTFEENVEPIVVVMDTQQQEDWDEDKAVFLERMIETFRSELFEMFGGLKPEKGDLFFDRPFSRDRIFENRTYKENGMPVAALLNEVSRKLLI